MKAYTVTEVRYTNF